MNLLKGKAVRAGNQIGVDLDGAMHVPLNRERMIELADSAPVTLGIRPEHCEVGESAFRVAVGSTQVLGSETIVHTETASNQPFTIAQRGISGARTGDWLPVSIREAFVHLFDENGSATSDWRSAYVN